MIAMLIDSHVHFWKYDKVRDAWMDPMPVLQQDRMPVDIQPIFSKEKVDGCIAVQAAQSETETLFLTKLSEEYSIIKGVVGWIDLQDKHVKERLEYFSRYQVIKGWRHIVQAEPDEFLSRKDFQNGIRSLAHYNYTYDILVFHQQLKEVLEFVDIFPDQKFVIDHCAKPNIAGGSIGEWARHIKELAKYPKVYCKLSGLLSEAKWHQWKAEDITPYLDTVFEAFGTNRIMFGSDWPVLNLAGNYHQWKNLLEDYMKIFTEEDRQKIFGTNAVTFYAL